MAEASPNGPTNPFPDPPISRDLAIAGLGVLLGSVVGWAPGAVMLGVALVAHLWGRKSPH